MDPVSLDQLFYELRSVNAESVCVPAAELQPGYVIASGTMERHVISGRPKPHFTSATLAFPARHLHGGHDVPFVVADTADVRVYSAHVAEAAVTEVPVVPVCAIPDAPAVGDRVVMQPYTAHALGVAAVREFTGEGWKALTPLGPDSLSTNVMRRMVEPPVVGTLDGWFVYLPAGRRPYLYADGQVVPARPASELTENDVMLIPGGGRLEVQSVTRHGDGASVGLRVLTPSRHEMRHLTWISQAGDLVEHHDSGLRGYLYATELRAGEAAPGNAELSQHAA